jgi:hypothetical protein
MYDMGTARIVKANYPKPEAAATDDCRWRDIAYITKNDLTARVGEDLSGGGNVAYRFRAPPIVSEGHFERLSYQSRHTPHAS